VAVAGIEVLSQVRAARRSVEALRRADTADGHGIPAAAAGVLRRRRRRARLCRCIVAPRRRRRLRARTGPEPAGGAKRKR
jgi:hypothetical protein